MQRLQRRHELQLRRLVLLEVNQQLRQPFAVGAERQPLD
jgi:hypothetical protein